MSSKRAGTTSTRWGCSRRGRQRPSAERGGKLSVTDGPFAETKEQFGGFTVIEARDLNEAIQLASKMPSARLGSVEVRPAMDLEAELTDPQDRKAAAAIRRAMGMDPEAWKVKG